MRTKSASLLLLFLHENKEFYFQSILSLNFFSFLIFLSLYQILTRVFTFHSLFLGIMNALARFQSRKNRFRASRVKPSLLKRETTLNLHGNLCNVTLLSFIIIPPKNDLIYQGRLGALVTFFLEKKEILSFSPLRVKESDLQHVVIRFGPWKMCT